MKKFSFGFAFSLSILPLLAFAAPPASFKGLVDIILDYIELLIQVIFAATFLVFMWGVVKGWIIGGASEEGVDQGKNVVLAGIIAFVVMSSIWGIVYIFQSTLFGR